MRLYKVIAILGFTFMLIGCSANTEMDMTKNNDNNIELTKINTNKAVNQQPSNQAKEILENDPDITTVKAVNTSKVLLVAIEIQHSKRFGMDEIEKELKKKIQKKFPNKDVVFSTDQKIVLELDQLEKDIQANKISNKQLDKRTKKIITLSKEKT